MEFQVKVTGSELEMDIIEEVIDNKFKVKINPSVSYLGMEVDGVVKGSTICTALKSK